MGGGGRNVPPFFSNPHPMKTGKSILERIK
jgi:hypothetical protein